MRDRIFAHITWTTRDRAKLIDSETADWLKTFLSTTCIQERARLLELGMVQTHVHAIARLHPSTQIPKLLQRLKGGSSNAAGKLGLPKSGKSLKWDRGYNIESVSPRNLHIARMYVRNQPSHHPDEAIVE